MCEKKVGLVPRLRFPDYVGQRLRKALLMDVTAESGDRIGDDLSKMPVMGVTKVEGIVPMEERLISSDITRYKIVKNNWFAYNPMRLNIGSIARWEGEQNILVSPDYVVFKCLKGADLVIDPEYLDHFRQSGAWARFVSESGDGSVRVRIYYRDLARLQLFLPGHAEQQKIADCLSSLDALITAQADKLDTLKTHKQGLMQQIFPREGETVPRLRFPEFREAGEWSKKNLGAIATFYKGKGISKADIVENGVQPCIRYGELYTIYGETIHKIVSNTNVDASELFLSKKNDVIIPSSGETKIDIAKASCVLNDDIALGSDLNIIRSNQNGIFLSYQLNGPLRVSIAKVAQGDTVVHLYPTQIKQLNVLVPCPNEQQKIANCLSSIDALIDMQVDKLDALKTHKKALMQQLFPSPEAVEA